MNDQPEQNETQNLNVSVRGDQVALKKIVEFDYAIKHLRSDLQHLRSDLKENYVTKAEFAESERRKLKWWVGILIGLLGVVMALVFGVVDFVIRTLVE